MNLRVHWCPPAACWIADLFQNDGTPIVQGLAVVTGADLLQQFGYMGFAGQLIAQTDHETDAVPTFTNLGSSGHVYYLTP